MPRLKRFQMWLRWWMVERIFAVKLKLSKKYYVTSLGAWNAIMCIFIFFIFLFHFSLYYFFLSPFLSIHFLFSFPTYPSAISPASNSFTDHRGLSDRPHHYRRRPTPTTPIVGANPESVVPATAAVALDRLAGITVRRSSAAASSKSLQWAGFVLAPSKKLFSVILS